MRSLLLMIQFMTRYPIPLVIEFTAAHFVRGMKWMPLVGLLVGLPAAAGFLGLNALFGRELGAVAAVLFGIVVTGGLHLDGLADSADGLFSYRPRERILEIMRDSTLGTNGVTTIVLAVLIRYILLYRLPEQAVPAALLCAPVLGRMAVVWQAACASYARESRGLGEFVNQTGLRQALAAALFSCILVAAILAILGLRAGGVLATVLLHGFAIPPAILFTLYLKKRLGGITGDTLGATIELTELFHSKGEPFPLT